MPKPRRAVTVLSFEEFMRQPRTPQQVETYHLVVAAMQRLGIVDAEMKVVQLGKLK